MTETEEQELTLVQLLARLSQDPVNPDFLLNRLGKPWQKNGDGPPTLAQLCHRFGERYGELAYDDSFEESAEFARISEAWYAAAVGFGHFEAALTLAALQPERALHWYAKAFAIGIDTLKASADQEWIDKLVDIVQPMWILNAGQGRQCLDDLLSWASSEGRDEHMAALRKVRDELCPPGPALQVLTRIAPSSDKTVKAYCDLYKNMVQEPTPLAPISDLQEVAEVLNREFSWFGEATRWILIHLSARLHSRSPGFKLPSLLLVGPPGIGKTSYIKRLAVLCGVPFRFFNLAGSSDNRSLAGTSRGWGTGHPSQILDFLREANCANPMVFLDEIDKAGGSDRNGRVQDTLLTLLEPATAKIFNDEYFWAPADLSRVSFVASANDYLSLPAPLLDRCKVIRMYGPARSDYPTVVRACIDAFFREHEIDPAWLEPLTPEEWRWLERRFTNPRQVRKAVESLLSYKLQDPHALRH